MGSSKPSRSASADSTVDGRPVTFVYNRTAEGGATPNDTFELKWSGDGDDGAVQSPGVPDSNIITVRQIGTLGEYNIAYAEEPNPSGVSGHSPVTFRAITATDLPDEFIARHGMATRSVWRQWIDRPQTRPDVHVVVSTGSGTGLAHRVWESLVKPAFDHFGIDPVVHLTSSPGTVAELTKTTVLDRSNRGLEQVIVLLSGDGGIIDMVNGLLAGVPSPEFKRPYVSLLPLGTGNALANSAGITGDRTFGLSAMLRGEPSPLPMFRARFSPGTKLLVDEGRQEQDFDSSDADGHPSAYGAVVCSWGMHAALVADSDTAEYRKHGSERFKTAAKEAFFPSDGSPPHAYTGEVAILARGATSWRVLDRREHAYVLATFCSQLEAGFTISPESGKLDGRLRLVFFGAVSGSAAMEIMTKAFQGGKHIEDERVGYEEIEGLKINFEEDDGRWRRICIDGTIARVERGGWVEVTKAGQAVLDLIA